MQPITRKLYADKVDAWLGKGQIIVLTGQRRVGKSYILKDFVERHKAEPQTNFIYINKERKKFDAIKNYEQLNEYIDEHWMEDAHNFILIDEVQEIEGWEVEEQRRSPPPRLWPAFPVKHAANWAQGDGVSSPVWGVLG